MTAKQVFRPGSAYGPRHAAAHKAVMRIADKNNRLAASVLLLGQRLLDAIDRRATANRRASEALNAFHHAQDADADGAKKRWKAACEKRATAQDRLDRAQDRYLDARASLRKKRTR